MASDAVEQLTDPHVQSVIEKHAERANFGKQKYGVDLTRKDVDFEGWIIHLQEELMDAAVYAERILHDHRKTQNDGK